MSRSFIARGMRRAAGAAALVSVMMLAACGGGNGGGAGDNADASSGGATASESGNAEAASGQLTVFAAKSLSKVFEQVASEVLATSHPDITVTFSFDGSNTLVKQIIEGAPVDVIATADEDTMADLSAANLTEDLTTFATNTLRLTVPAGNPGEITGLDDSLAGKKLVICAPRVPCGRATVELTEQLGITLQPVSEENNVGQVRAKIESGQADAGLIYLTDARAAGDAVEIVEVPGIDQVVNRYPIAIVPSTANRAAAEAFIAAVLSDEGLEILADAGFSAPDK